MHVRLGASLAVPASNISHSSATGAISLDCPEPG
jgi:hypothetical protein